VKKNVIVLQEHPKKIDSHYFNNYGGYNYSDSYKKYTVDPRNVVDSLVKHNIFFETLLDAGCASGELVSDFRRLGIGAFGIEKNEDILKKCVVPQFCTAMDLRDMSGIKNNSFDILYCNAAMYLFPQEILSVLKEFYRITNKAVFLCNPFLEENGSNTFSDPSRVFLATETWWEKQFKEADFKRITENIYQKN